jgi:hypothetical protein
MLVSIQPPPTGPLRVPRTGGNAEFWGNGPQVDVNAHIFARGPKLFLRYTLRFIEIGGDSTTFEGSNELEIYDVSNDYPGKIIQQITTALDNHFIFTDKDVNINTFHLGVTGLIKYATIQGDTYGGWFGGSDDPWVELTFNPVILKIPD